MAVQHKFYQTDFGNRFATNNAILNKTPYKPEVMIIGTYNPVHPNNADVDFFYGRNWFWTIFANYFIHNQTLLNQKRIYNNFQNPSLDEILDLCIKLKLTFSDLITKTMHNGNPNYNLIPTNKVHFNNNYFSLINDNGLEGLNHINQVEWNTQNIINYLIENPTIKYVYLTRKPSGVWQNQWNLISNNLQLQHIHFTNIHSPSGLGLQEAGIPISQSLAKRWIVNNSPNIGVFDNNWLINNGVTIENFIY
jgi:hypothetical protein